MGNGNMLHLEPVNGKNIRNILKLKVSEDQRGFVESNETSIIEAYTAIRANYNAFPYGIYEDDTLVGFLMIGFDINDYWDNVPQIAKGNYTIRCLMIDEAYQNRGYGKKAVMLALDYIRQFPCGTADYCWLSYSPKNEGARQLFSSFGFIEAVEIDVIDGEVIIAVLKL